MEMRKGTLGKPFETEIEALPSTYAWAISQPIDRLCKAVERLCVHPLLAVGSGGSFTVCHFATHLHGLFARQPTVSLTPLQAIDRRTPIAASGVLLPTAGGNNPDVIAAVRLLSEKEPKSLLILCGNPESRVASLASRYGLVDFIPFELPTGKDGFLATNSLLAFCVLLTRAYLVVSGHSPDLPKNYRDLLTDARVPSTATVSRRYAKILARNTLVVLHGPATAAAAIDVESKFTEAALGHVQICDFRQFAHGRHHWLAKRDDDTAILSLESLDDDAVAEQTLAILPKSVPTVRLRLPHRTWSADLSALCEGYYLVRAAGVQRNIDPGRPGVPSFGRKLYHANAFPMRRNASSMAAWQVRAIERKALEALDQLADYDRLSFWTDALDSVLHDVASTRFCGVVLDYDGTLCGEDQRFEPLPREVVSSLTTYLESHALLGIATGRGKSVRERLHEALPRKFWPQVTVGYYNGGQILPLNSDELPDGAERVNAELQPLADAIAADRLLAKGAVALRARQITLSAPLGVSLDALCEHAEALVNRVAPSGLRVMRSGHSVDIVPEAVSKLSVVERLVALAGTGNSNAVLRIGDRGRWPGNDAQLLASPYGFSVHEVSSDASTCWNIAPPGHRGWQATLWYLRNLRISKHRIRFRLPPSGRG
jgi:fructoselysine-6-P-deglycase FrlB-like protein